MVEIKYMSKKGDTPIHLPLALAKSTMTKEMDAGKLVVNLDEKAVVTRATMGQLGENSRIGVFNPVAGG
jgi:hypothetical protein